MALLELGNLPSRKQFGHRSYLIRAAVELDGVVFGGRDFAQWYRRRAQSMPHEEQLNCFFDSLAMSSMDLEPEATAPFVVEMSPLVVGSVLDADGSRSLVD